MLSEFSRVCVCVSETISWVLDECKAYLYLHQEVPKVLFEGRNILIQAEQTGYEHFHLRTGKKKTAQFTSAVWQAHAQQHTHNLHTIFSPT